MAKILPLSGKFYGTLVEYQNGGLITIWEYGPQPWEASSRELENGWLPEDGFNHIETKYCHQIASIICDALTKKGL